MQKKISSDTKVAYLGPRGTWSEIASEYLAPGAIKVPGSSFAEVLEMAETGRTDSCVLPVENSVEGPVSSVIDLIVGSKINITGEAMVSVRHMLLSNSEKIERIYSHPQAIAQCRNTITRLYPHARIYETSSTAEMARKVKDEVGSAIIGSSRISELYGLGVKARDVCDYSRNLTRFVMLSRGETVSTGKDKTTITFVLKGNIAGSLVNALLPFSTRNINLSMVMSRPEKYNPGTYRFFLDVLGHSDDDSMKDAVSELSGQCSSIRILGCYPRSSWDEAAELQK
ncbi:MAG: prephenate dehydratase [Candidatus Thermoplasmatota archaeon]|nr:prephenate dehydratase [Candidatus Thermoplasmatota archaeon]